jgi:hypothetical protein
MRTTGIATTLVKYRLLPSFSLNAAAGQFLDHPDAFVSENSARYTGWNVSFQNVKVCAADRRLHHFDYRLTWLLKFGSWSLFN